MAFPRQDFYKQRSMRHRGPSNFYLLLFKQKALAKYAVKLTFTPASESK